MALALTSRLLRPFAFGGRLLPLFDKELRVASRRRRGYTLRFVYVLLLMLFIAMVWVPTVHLRGGGAMSRAQMEMAAKIITRSIVWFQFFGAQLVAVIMMSTTISEEVYGRTLCVLMTTPLSSRQVVMGKFFSRLFQILLLVATSLPLLAIVRVLGGIPWSYLWLSLCVTIVTVCFAGAVSLFISALCRRAHLVVIASVLSMAFLFFVLPYATCLALGIPLWRLRGLATLAPMNPYVLLGLSQGTSRLFGFHGAAAPGLISTISCCGFLLLGTVVLLRGSVRLVHRVSLRRAMGEPVLLECLRRKDAEELGINETPGGRRREIRRVVGPPMIWKEMTCTLSRRERFVSRTVVGVEIVLIFIAYLFPMMMSIVSYEFLHLTYLCGFLAVGVLLTMTASATVIGRERESRAWPLLLMTPLTDADILIGKCVGVLRRCGLVWLLLFAYVVGFSWARCFHSMAVAHVAVIIVSALPFLAAAGLYFGVRCRRTIDAVTANLVLAGALWCVFPIVAQVISYGAGASWDVGMSLVFAMVPFGQTVAMVATTLDGYSASLACFGRAQDAGGIATLLLHFLGGYLLLSLLFMWRAVRGFRRRIF